MQKFDQYGAFVDSAGPSGTMGGIYTEIFAIAVDANDNLFIADYTGSSIQILDPDGQVTMTVQLDPRVVLLEPDKTFVLSVTRNGRRTSTGVYFPEIPDYEVLKQHVLDTLRGA